MRAADTNVLLRLITGDDPDQEEVVRRLLAVERLHVSLTVAMECEWVLRSYYRMSRSVRAESLMALLVLDSLEFEQPAALRWACERLRDGAEFDDMLHLIAAAAGKADGFVTFDRAIVRHAEADSPVPVETLG